MSEENEVVQEEDNVDVMWPFLAPIAGGIAGLIVGGVGGGVVGSMVSFILTVFYISFFPSRKKISCDINSEQTEFGSYKANGLVQRLNKLFAARRDD